MKLLLTFEKGEPVRWLGHLDVMRAFERAIRRSGLPVAFSSGFNPRERLSFASALGVGVTGGAERAVIELADPVPPEDAMQTLNRTLPAGLRVTAAETIADEGSRTRLNAFRRSELELTCSMDRPDGERVLADAIGRAMALREWPVLRRSDKQDRSRDIRPYVRTIEIVRCTAGEAVLLVWADIEQDGAARPEEIVEVLAREAPGLTLRRAHRVRLIERSAPGCEDQPECLSLEGGENPH